MFRNDPPAWSRVPRLPAGVLCAVAVLLVAGCSEPPETPFTLERATKHVRMLATAIGSRPVGSHANRLAREYVASRLRESGYTVRLQEASSDTASGVTASVVNVIATRPGRQSEAVALVSHYDSPPESRGAADDGLGVAVCLEAARVLAGRDRPRYTLVVALTDGEEAGLMGARALKSAPEMATVRAFLNFEAVGTTGPARLFQAGPGNVWLPGAWAASAPLPSGSSLMTEIYRRLPHDTDFSVLSQAGAPGLDFAATGNTFAYHTTLDTPERLEPSTVKRLGDTAVRLVETLDGLDVRLRTPEDGTFFDVAGRRAFSYSSGRTRIVAVVTFVIGLLAALKAFRAARDEVGLTRIVVTALWAVFGVGAIFVTLCVGCSLVRLGTGLEQPWYAQGSVFFVLLCATGLGALWLVILLGRSLPVMVGPSGHPSCVWALTLPSWAAVLAVLQRTAPGVGYLFAFPLLAASVLVLGLPIRRPAVGRGVSAVVAVVAGLLWLPLWWPSFEFLIGLFGSLPFAPPVWVYPAVALVSVATVGPPLAGLFLGRTSRLVPAGAVSSLLLLAVVASAWVISVEPAYTSERPERRTVRYVQDMIQQKAWWEAGTHERDAAPTGADAAAPRDWRRTDEPPALSLRLRPVAGPFRYRTRASGLVAPPLDVRATVRTVEGSSDAWVEVTAVSRLEGTCASFVLPWGVTPIDASLRGVVLDGRWRASVRPVPPEGATLRVRLSADGLSRLADARVAAFVYGIPGGIGWQRLPPWLRQDTVVWRAESYFVLPWPAPLPPALPAPAQ